MGGKVEIEGFRCLPTAPDFAQKDSSHVHSYTGSGLCLCFQGKAREVRAEVREAMCLLRHFRRLSDIVPGGLWPWSEKREE